MIDEGYTKFNVEWTRDAPFDTPLIAALERARHRLFVAGLIGYDPRHRVGFGNLSARLPHGFLISGTQTGHHEHTDGRHYAEVTAYDLAANRLECRGPVQASSESLTHAAVFDARGDVQAIVHVHDMDLWSSSLDRIPTTSRSVAYGTPDMARELARLVVTREFAASGVAAMGGHDGGLIATGDSLSDATTRILDFREQTARRRGEG